MRKTVLYLIIIIIMTQQTKQQEFRKYLESGQVIESLNRAMTELHHQDPPPEDPLAFIRQVIGAPPGPNVDALIRENQDLTALLAIRKQELARLQGLDE